MDRLPVGPNQLQTPQFVATQFSLPSSPLTTPSTAAAVTNINVRDVLQVIWRWMWLIVLLMALSLGTAAYLSKHTPPRWKATAELLMVQRSNLVQTGQDGTTNVIGQLAESVDTQVALLQTLGMAQKTIDYLKNQAITRGDSPDTVTYDKYQLKGNTTAANVTSTNLIDVTMEAGSADEAVKLANATCDAFVEWKNKVAKQSFQDALNSLEDRANRAKQQMEQAEHQELMFKQNHKLIDVSAELASKVQTYVEAQQQAEILWQDIQLQRANVNLLGSWLQSARQRLSHASSVPDQGLAASLQARIDELQIDKHQAELKYTAAYPGPDGPTAIEFRIEDLQKLQESVIHDAAANNSQPSVQTVEALTSQYDTAMGALQQAWLKYQATAQRRDALKAQAQDVPLVSLQYAQISNNAARARTAYSTLEAAVQNANVDTDLATGNIEVAQYADPPQAPFAPNFEQDLISGALAGVVLSIVAVLLLEQSDRRIRSIVSLRRLVPGPIIGTLPRLSRVEWQRLMSGQPCVESTEAYSLARANLSLALRDSGIGMDAWRGHLMLITSCVPREGKSLTAAELARSIARAGRSVILVDADMRRPSQNRLFNTAEPIGLADVLIGAVSIEDALVASGTENLSILHAGRPSRNPTEMVSLPEMAEVLRALRGEAELVIVDTPACAVVADALFLAPYADSILHVVGCGLVDEELVRNTVAAISAAAPRTMTFFLNRAPRQRGAGYKSYYYYRTEPSNRGGGLPVNVGRGGSSPAGAGFSTGGPTPGGMAGGGNGHDRGTLTYGGQNGNSHNLPGQIGNGHGPLIDGLDPENPGDAR